MKKKTFPLCYAVVFILQQDAQQERAEVVELAKKEERRKYEEFITQHEVCLCALRYIVIIDVF